MACILLHVIEEPDPDAYDDADLKDLVGSFPRCFCARHNPPRALRPSEAVKCFECSVPCWDPAGAMNEPAP